VIDRIEVLHAVHRIHIWSAEQDSKSAPFLCAIQLYEVTGSVHNSPRKLSTKIKLVGDVNLKGEVECEPIDSYSAERNSMILVEFVRGQLNIFTFKKFYRWIRSRVVQLVKKDYAFQLLDNM